MAQDIPHSRHFEEQQARRQGVLRDAAEQAGADAAQTARRMAGAGFGTANQMAQDATNRFANVFSRATPEAHKAVRRTSQSLTAVMGASATLSEASQSIWREWLDYTQQAARQQVNGLQKIASARSPHDLIDAQFALVREEMRTFLDSAVRISALSSKAVRAAADQVREDEEDDEDGDQAEHPQRRRA